MEKHRIFVAIDIPEELKNITEKHLEPFYKNKLARVAEKDNWHTTVVFCGYLTDEEIEKLKKLAKKSTEEVKKFELIPDKIIFAPPKKPRMVWITFKPSDAFEKLSRKLIDFTDKNMLRPLSHTTLVRFKEFHYYNFKKLLPENGIDLKKETEPFMVESINIMESHLSAKGPKYELLEKIKLS